ncbi:unnamed protein product [Prorocentrum cordatum]|uniref:Uncharacterized protein n=1 Tax=Prorocentrum cordatum TaxID=2364126 RepID=A0ABN9WTL7_9DINO|nr:unnamed protein product [Polarella glacialis]
MKRAPGRSLASRLADEYAATVVTGVPKVELDELRQRSVGPGWFVSEMFLEVVFAPRTPSRDGFLVEARRRRGVTFANRSAQIGFLYLRSSVLSVVKAVAMLLVVFPPPWRRTAALEMLQAELFCSLELILLCVVASLRKRASLFGMGSLVLPLVAVPSEAVPWCVFIVTHGWYLKRNIGSVHALEYVKLIGDQRLTCLSCDLLMDGMDEDPESLFVCSLGIGHMTLDFTDPYVLLFVVVFFGFVLVQVFTAVPSPHALPRALSTSLRAVVAAYSLGQEDPMQVLCSVLRGYVSVAPVELSRQELEVFFQAARGRVLLSVAFAAENMALEPDNEYLAHTSEPGWAVLQKLGNVDAAVALSALSDAIGGVSRM